MVSINQKWLFEILYTNRYLYRFASTFPFAGHWQTWQRLVIPYLNGNFVLELGCGLGDLLADMIEVGYDCRAIEQSQEMVNTARETLKERQCGELTWIVKGETQCLPFDDNTFDTVVSTFPSEYIYDSKTISEAKRVLRPGGQLIVLIGANFLQTDPIQSLLLLIQFFTYNSIMVLRFLKSGKWHKDYEKNLESKTQIIPDAKWGKQIPLEQHELVRHCERVFTPYWEAYIVIGKK